LSFCLALFSYYSIANIINKKLLTYYTRRKEEMKTIKKDKVKTTKGGSTKKDVIAFRKTCNARGTGLSHYILMDRKKR